MTKRLILHIGAEKTGTTTIQEFLALNRDRLRERGFLFPSSVGGKNHTRLAIFAAHDKRGVCVNAARNLARTDLEEFRSKIKYDLSRELTTSGWLDSPDCSIVFSAEHMHSQLQTREELTRLKELLPTADELKVIFYIRRQDRAAVSLYSTALKAGGGGDEFAFPNTAGKLLPYRYDYWRAYDLWASIFGKENMVVRLFDKAEFINGDLIEDFCFASAIPWLPDYQRPTIKNPSMDVNGEFVFKQLNKLISTSDEVFRREDLLKLKDILATSFTGHAKSRPAHDAAVSFFKKFQDGNARLREEAFPERMTPLFDEDFSEYPTEKISASELADPVVICNVLLKAWLEVARQTGSARHPGKKGSEAMEAKPLAKRLLHNCVARTRCILPRK